MSGVIDRSLSLLFLYSLRYSTVEDVDEVPAEEELTAHADDDEYKYWALNANVSSDDEPKTWKQAQNSPFSSEWHEAYQAELDSIKLHGVYELVPPESVPAGRKIICSRPIFKIKWGSDGEILRIQGSPCVHGLCANIWS